MNLCRIEIPVTQNSSLTFGAPNREDIRIISAAQSDPMPVMLSGNDATSGNAGRARFPMHCALRSRLEHKEDFLTGC